MEAATVSAIISATAGISGVVLGGAITTWKDVWLAQRKAHKDAQYLAILLGTELGVYVDRCIAVAFDDGRGDGEWRDFEDERTPQEESPSFNPRDLELEWKSLTPALLDEIFSFPSRAEELRHTVASIEEYAPDPPDHLEYFWQRRKGWAEIGLQVAGIVRRLRAHAGLANPPAADFLGTREARLQEAIQMIERERRDNAGRIARSKTKRLPAQAGELVSEPDNPEGTSN